MIEIHRDGLPPIGCPIVGSNKLPVQRQADRQIDVSVLVISSLSCEVKKNAVLIKKNVVKTNLEIKFVIALSSKF